MARTSVVHFNRESGVTILELLVVVVLMATGSALSLGWYQSASAEIQGDADQQVVQGLLKRARETAINERRSVEVRFVAPSLITLVRRDLPDGTTLLQTETLQHHTSFFLFDGMPDTPDGFGRNAAVDFGGASQVMFTADGQFTNQAGTAANGTIFLGQPGRRATARAISIFGPTAHIRLYRWNGTSWAR